MHIRRQYIAQRLRHERSLLHIGDTQAHAAGATVAKYPGGIFVIDEGQRGIIFVISGRKEPRNRELAHAGRKARWGNRPLRSEEHTSDLQSLMRNSYAVFCLKKK